MQGMPDTNALLQAVANSSTGEGQPARGFAALDNALQQYPGHRLFTILAINWDAEENQRVYTSSPESYPAGDAKPLHRNSAFFRTVVDNKSSRICRNAEECRAAFFDFELIARLGCASAVNVPIISGGMTIGSLNLLHEEGWYTPDMLPVLSQFATLSASLLRPSSSPSPSPQLQPLQSASS